MGGDASLRACDFGDCTVKGLEDRSGTCSSARYWLKSQRANLHHTARMHIEKICLPLHTQTHTHVYARTRAHTRTYNRQNRGPNFMTAVALVPRAHRTRTTAMQSSSVVRILSRVILSESGVV